MTALERLPPWSTTGIGSVPHATASAAAAHAVAAYDVPFCPQLPALDGDMVAQWLGADPAGCGWSPDRDAARPRAFGGFVAELRAHPPRHRVVKLQVTGPVTLAVALEREAGRRPEIAPVAALAVELSTWLAANTAALVEDLRALGLDVVLLADEPALATCGVAELARV